MGPHFERRRVSSHEDPRLEIHELRARNDFKLKSAFETIFDKYGQDFSGLGDEIDLETGEIVVNNGHILGMRDEVDVGYDQDDTEGDELANDMLSDSEEEDLPVESMEKSLDLREQEQEQPTTTADSKPSQSVMDGLSTLMRDVQDIDLVLLEGEMAGEISTSAAGPFASLQRSDFSTWESDLQLVSESGNPGRTLDTIDANAHLTPEVAITNKRLSLGARKAAEPAEARSSSGPLENHLPGGTWHSIKGHPDAIGSSTRLWTEGDDRLLWHLKTNTKLVERELVPYFSGKTQRQIMYRWHYSKDFARNKEMFNTTLPGIATARDDRWLLELIANSMLPPAEPAQHPLQHDEQSDLGREVTGNSASITATGIDTELGLNLDISHDVVDMKEEPLERPSFTPTEKSAILIPSQKPSPVTVQPSPHKNDSAKVIMPRTSSSSEPKSKLVRRPSKSRRRVRQSTRSNPRTTGAKLHANAISSTPFRSQRHSTRFSKPTPAISFTSMLGYDSEEDELSRPEKIIGTPKIGRATTQVSTARKCGTLGFKCTRSVCLRCA
ncbi:MAG: hypothetical protein LQ347_003766 [Umbilicaria vellea]|nr:MAG: hypothetical protein LQ347_003766 [Umbilicaria vellea]